MDSSITAIIPARGGSTRIPRKNLALLNGRPLIAFTCEEAKKSKRLTRIILSTDDHEIAAAAMSFGIDVPFVRPKRISDDDTPMISVIQHALEFLTTTGEFPKALVLLQPTSPLRTAAHIDAAIDLFLSQTASSVVTIVRIPHRMHPQKALTMKGGRVLSYLESDSVEEAPGKLPPAYARNGPAVVVTSPETVRSGKLYGDTVLGLEMPVRESVDIDDPIDLVIAGALLRSGVED